MNCKVRYLKKSSKVFKSCETENDTIKNPEYAAPDPKSSHIPVCTTCKTRTFCLMGCVTNFGIWQCSSQLIRIQMWDLCHVSLEIPQHTHHGGQSKRIWRESSKPLRNSSRSCAYQIVSQYEYVRVDCRDVLFSKIYISNLFRVKKVVVGKKTRFDKTLP